MVDDETDHNVPAEHQPPPAFDAAFLGRAQNVAVEIEPAGPHLARELHRIGPQADHVAVAGGDHVPNAVELAELGMRLEVRRLAMDGDEHGGLHPVIEALELLAARMARRMHEAV